MMSLRLNMSGGACRNGQTLLQPEPCHGDRISFSELHNPHEPSSSFGSRQSRHLRISHQDRTQYPWHSSDLFPPHLDLATFCSHLFLISIHDNSHPQSLSTRSPFHSKHLGLIM